MLLFKASEEEFNLDAELKGVFLGVVHWGQHERGVEVVVGSSGMKLTG